MCQGQRICVCDWAEIPCSSAAKLPDWPAETFECVDCIHICQTYTKDAKSVAVRLVNPPRQVVPSPAPSSF